MIKLQIAKADTITPHSRGGESEIQRLAIFRMSHNE